MYSAALLMVSIVLFLAIDFPFILLLDPLFYLLLNFINQIPASRL